MRLPGGRSGAGEVTAPDGRPRIELDAVGMTFPTRGGTTVEALKDVSLEVGGHEFVALLGPSGCGKTTILRLIDGLIAPSSGRIRVFGRPPRPGPEIGFVFQSFRLIPWLSVARNVAFALRDLPLSDEERRERVGRHLALVGLSKFHAAYPRELSGGMKQRVALARALAPDPQILLMDEPFASIDAQTRELMQVELMRIWTLRRSAVLFVTHSVDEAILLADRIALLSPSPGRIAEVVDVALERPRWEYDVRSDPRYLDLRRYLSARMKEFVFSDPTSEFHGRHFGPEP